MTRRPPSDNCSTNGGGTEGAPAETRIASYSVVGGALQRSDRRPAHRAIAFFDADIPVAEARQTLAGLTGKGRLGFDSSDIAGQQREYGSLVAGPGSYLQDALMTLKRKSFGHCGDHERPGGCLGG